jgi:hypothetical protein
LNEKGWGRCPFPENHNNGTRTPPYNCISKDSPARVRNVSTEMMSSAWR